MRSAALARALVDDRQLYLRHSPDPIHNGWIARREPSHTQTTVERFEQINHAHRTITVIVPVGQESLGRIWRSLRTVRRQTIPPRDTRLLCTQGCLPGRRRLMRLLIALTPGVRFGTAVSWLQTAHTATQWVVPLWPGDRLPARALAVYQATAAAHPEAALLYGDEDTYEPAIGARREPILKPGWAPITLLAQDTIGRAICLKRDRMPPSVLHAIGEGPEALYALALALARASETGQHIPEFLLHLHPTATPKVPNDSADAMLTAHFAALGIPDAHCSHTPSGGRQVSWRPQHWPSVSVIVIDDAPSHARLVHAIETLRAGTDYPDWDITIHRTTPPPTRMQRWAADVHPTLQFAVSDAGESRAGALSRLAGSARGDCVLFLDPRVEPLDQNWLRELVMWSELPGVGATGPLILDADGHIRSGGIATGLGLLYGHLHEGMPADGPVPFGDVSTARDVTAVSLGALLVRRDALRDVQGFGPEPADTYLDVSLCTRLRARGYHVICTPTARVQQDIAVVEHSHEDIQPLADILERQPCLTDPFLHPRLSVVGPLLTVQPADTLPATDVIAQQLKTVRAACHPCDPLDLTTVRADVPLDPHAGYRVRQLLDARWDLRFFFPLATLPWGQSGLIQWLHTQGQSLAISDGEIQAFQNETEADPGQELALTWQRMPEWQRRHPHGLTPEKLPALFDWISRVYHVPRAELDNLQVPSANDPDKTTHGESGANVLAHFCLPCGVGLAAQTCMNALQSTGYRTSARDLPAAPTGDPPDRRNWLGLECYPITVLFVQPEFALEDWLSRGRLCPSENTYRIGNWYWEFTEVPDRWRRHAIDFDEVWAPTRFLETAFKQSLQIPVTYMPPGLSISFEPRTRAHFGLPEDRFIFLFLFDTGSSMERKNPRGVIDAFRQAIRHDDNALLVVKTSRGSHFPTEIAALQEYAEGLDVHFMDGTLARNDILALMNCCDCYVSLHRSEGLGLPLAEAMLMGKPAIATAYSGNLDFMTPDNSLLVDAARVPLDRDWGPYKAGWIWADPDIDQAAAHMRHVLDDRDDAAHIAAHGHTDAHRHFDMEAYATRMATRLKTIGAEL